MSNPIFYSGVTTFGDIEKTHPEWARQKFRNRYGNTTYDPNRVAELGARSGANKLENCTTEYQLDSAGYRP